MTRSENDRARNPRGDYMASGYLRELAARLREGFKSPAEMTGDIADALEAFATMVNHPPASPASTTETRYEDRVTILQSDFDSLMDDRLELEAIRASAAEKPSSPVRWLVEINGREEFVRFERQAAWAQEKGAVVTPLYDAPQVQAESERLQKHIQFLAGRIRNAHTLLANDEDHKAIVLLAETWLEHRRQSNG